MFENVLDSIGLIAKTDKEVADAMAASQAYSANVTMFNTMKTVISKGLEIGR